MQPNITFRPMTDDDLEFSFQVYASTREEELAQIDSDERLIESFMSMQFTPEQTDPPKNLEEQKESFLRQQFHAQHTDYQRNYPDAQFDVILADCEPIGRLYLDRREDAHCVVDIALLPDHQRQGIGGKIMQDILDEAATAEKKVRIHVEYENPAMHLYERLGFKRIDDVGIYYLMEWTPDS